MTTAPADIHPRGRGLCRRPETRSDTPLTLLAAPGSTPSPRSPLLIATLDRHSDLKDTTMARITIEDCIEKVPNRFHLVQMTAIRAKQLKRGAQALVEGGENKEVVTALREIAAGHVSPDSDSPTIDPVAAAAERPEPFVPVIAEEAPAVEKAPAEEAPPTEG